jgi:hypothetical protein
MRSDYELLRQLNIDIGEAEARGDTEFFEELLAPAFAMRRADGECIDDRERFIASVAESADRPTEVHSITFFQANRALVACTVTMPPRRRQAFPQPPALYTCVVKRPLAARHGRTSPLSRPFVAQVDGCAPAVDSRRKGVYVRPKIEVTGRWIAAWPQRIRHCGESREPTWASPAARGATDAAAGKGACRSPAASPGRPHRPARRGQLGCCLGRAP